MRTTAFSILLMQYLCSVTDSQHTVNDCVHIIDKKRYARTEIITINGLPTNIAYNNRTGQIFFTLLDIPSLLNDTVETKMEEYVVKNGSAKKIANFNGQTAIVDDEKGIVYFGSDKGIFIYDDWTTTALPVALPNQDIVQLYKSPNSNDIYAVFYPSHELYVISDGAIKHKVENVVANIVAVDHYENIFFQNDEKGLCVLLKGYSSPIPFLGLKTEAGRVLVRDENRILAATIDGLFHLEPFVLIPKKIAELEFVPSGMYATGGEYYISTAGKIYKYTRRGC